MELERIYFESCPACPAEMRVSEYRDDPETLVRVEDCPGCDHTDSYKIMEEANA